MPVLEEVNRHTAVTENFLFIATDKWGADPDVLVNPNVQNLLRKRHLLILDVETADIPE